MTELANKTPGISILLPTRGRTTMLRDSLLSLADRADDVSQVEILLGVDHDDEKTIKWCEENILPELDQRGCSYTVLGFDRLGYIRLNEYVNTLAAQAKGQWLVFWGDDAVMLTQGWDQRILEVDKFRVLRIPTHNQHPYAIFPIVPREWHELFGYVSAHQLSDSWVSQIAYMTDIVQDIEVEVIHDRFDITGNNNDDTFKNRPMLEGNINDARDFNHISWRNRRVKDATKISDHLEKQGYDMTWFRNVMSGKQNPWEKMTGPVCDPNKQLTQYK